MSIRLLIAEDQRLFRQSLRLLLEREPDLTVVGEATNGHEAYLQAMDQKPDVVLMDVDMPNVDGITATKLILGCSPGTKVLMLSVHDDDTRIVSAVLAGASGYILKDADHQEFLRIIRDTHRGKQVESPFMPDRFARRAVGAIYGDGPKKSTGLALLTEREREILSHAAAGKGNKEIADQLCVSLDTVKTHLHHIYHKLGVSGRVEAILVFLHST
jgi:DNA-binding NarL/FixJ family response regulator